MSEVYHIRRMAITMLAASMSTSSQPINSWKDDEPVKKATKDRSKIKAARKQNRRKK